ncbi:MAG: TetR/AcrR family transcriptional regulator [Oscillospiraceae bacterium]|nr:TetR/AcrR family transcriptional regulator [Oscillospiraceae bacterium]
MNKSESKYFNTAARMDEALLKLLEQKEFAYITVKEICEKAGVNRSTFYLHYETIADLLAESMEYMNGQFREHFPDAESKVRELLVCPEEELFLLTPAYLRPYLSFVRQHRQLYRTVMENPAVFSTDETYQKMFEHIFDPILERFSVPSSYRNYMMLFYLNGLVAIVREWLKGDCADPVDHVIVVIQQCVMQCQEHREN